MTITLSSLPTLVFVIVMICWFAFAGVFFFRRKPPSPPDKQRDGSSITGVVLQGLGFAIVWGLHRQAFTPFVSGNQTIVVAAALIAVLAAVGSVLLVMSAVKTLGKEWSITARL